MAKICGVHHIALKSTEENFRRTISFYTDILGFSIVRRWGEGSGRGAMISCGDNTVMEITANGMNDKLPDGAIQHIAFDIDDPDEMIRALREEGYEVTMEPKDVTIASDPPYPVRVAFVRGPVNEHIELFKVY